MGNDILLFWGLFGQNVMARTQGFLWYRGEKVWERKRRMNRAGGSVCLCFQCTVESAGGQQCLWGSSVTMHSVSLFQTSLLLSFQHPPLWIPRNMDPVCHHSSIKKKKNPLITSLSFPASLLLPSRPRPPLMQRLRPSWPLVHPSLAFAG